MCSRIPVVFVAVASLFFYGCQKQAQNIIAEAQVLRSGGSSSTSTGGAAANPNSTDAFQIITKADSSTGSFETVSVPTGGGIAAKAQRLFFLDGTLMSTSSIPTWYVESRVFLTSTRTSGTNPASPSTSNTPCAYFDSFTDNNPDTSGYYTIDGYNTSISGSDIDQCSGTNAAELSLLSLYVRIDRKFMSANDKLQFIVKTKIIDEPNTAPTASSCVTSGFFDAGACSNQYFTITMRASPGAAAKPFFILFPSAKALDLLSESILLPIHSSQSITTISIDRVKGGAVFYGFSVIRLP